MALRSRDSTGCQSNVTETGRSRPAPPLSPSGRWPTSQSSDRGPGRPSQYRHQPPSGESGVPVPPDSGRPHTGLGTSGRMPGRNSCNVQISNGCPFWKLLRRGHLKMDETVGGQSKAQGTSCSQRLPPRLLLPPTRRRAVMAVLGWPPSRGKQSAVWTSTMPSLCTTPELNKTRGRAEHLAGRLSAEQKRRTTLIDEHFKL